MMRTCVRSALLTTTLIGAGSALAGQAPAFEVASVKMSDPAPTWPLAMVPLVRPQAGGRLVATNAPLRKLVEVAYGVEDFQVAGGPSWVLTQRFHVVAAAANSNAALPDMLPMLRALLADRFKLKVHTEAREMTTSALIIERRDGQLGPNLAPSTFDCSSGAVAARRQAGQPVRCGVSPFGANGAFGINGKGQPIAVLVRLLSQVVGHAVEDRTGLAGLYDFELTFDPEMLRRRAAQAGASVPDGPTPTPPPTDSPALLTALKEQLGLELERQRSAVQVIVIDSAELPVPD